MALLRTVQVQPDDNALRVAAKRLKLTISTDVKKRSPSTPVKHQRTSPRKRYWRPSTTPTRPKNWSISYRKIYYRKWMKR